MPIGYVHWARERCAICGKHLRYLPWPEGMEQEAARARNWLKAKYRWRTLANSSSQGAASESKVDRDQHLSQSERLSSQGWFSGSSYR
jgi:hypothetical protein